METNRLNEAINAIATYQAEQDLYELRNKFLKILPSSLFGVRIRGKNLNDQVFDFALEDMFSVDFLIGSEMLKQLKKENVNKIVKDILSKAGYENI